VVSDQRAAVRARIAELGLTGLEDRRLRAEVLDQVRTVIDFDAHAWLLTDPQTRVGTAPLAHVPDMARLPSLIRLKYATSVNRWTTLAPNVCVTLAQATGGDLALSPLWRNLLRGYGVTDVASMVFADRFGCWGFLDLWRIGGAPSQFTASDQAWLSSLGVGLTRALRSGQAMTFAASPAAPDVDLGPTVLLFGPDLTLTGQTPQSDAHLRALLPTPIGSTPVPAAAYNAAAQLLAVETGIDSAMPQARAHLAGTRWLTLRAARLGGHGHGHGDGAEAMIAVTVEPIETGDRVDLYARATGLTVRERELLHRLTRGLSTRELAREMNLSPRTVPDHLKAIFAKTGTNSRGSLLARAVGTEPTSD
jgi:DNA-binding CsgD family transcriptional regulator